MSTSAADRLTALAERSSAPAPQAAQSIPSEVARSTIAVRAASGRIRKLETENRVLKTRLEKSKVAAKPKQKLSVPTSLMIVSRAIAAELIRRQDGNLDAEAALDRVVRPSDTLLYGAVEWMLKSSTNTAVTTSPGWASSLGGNLTASFLADLKNANIYSQLAALGTTFEFGPNGSVTVPYRDQTLKIPAGWVQENATIPVKSGAFNSVTIHRHKLGVLCSLSEEAVATTASNLVKIIEDAIRTDTSEAIDSYLLDGQPGVPLVRPPAIDNGNPTTPSSGATVEGINTDLKWLLTQAQGNRYRKPAILLNPLNTLALKMAQSTAQVYPWRDEIERFNTIFGVPLIQSANLPSAKVHICDAASFVTAAESPTFRAAAEASIVMLNDDGVDPTMRDPGAVDVAGSVRVDQAADVAGGPARVVSAFQQNLVIVRLTQPLTWAMTRPSMTATLTGVGW